MVAMSSRKYELICHTAGAMIERQTDRQTGANEAYGCCIHEDCTASESSDSLGGEHEKYCLLVRDAV